MSNNVFSCPHKHPWRIYKKDCSLQVIKKQLYDSKEMDLFNILSILYEDENSFVYHSKRNDIEFIYAKNQNFEIIITQRKALFKRK